jgi:ABC-type uncharacterized transport system substrate-binding protein
MTAVCARTVLPGAAGALGLLFGVFIEPAAAHPHVWVNVETTVVYDKGIVTGLRQRWFFDEFYTSMAIQGLDANNDGNYDRGELAELAKVNVEGLKEFDYFTFAQLGGQPLAFDAPADYLMELTETAEAPSQGGPGAVQPDQPKDGGSFWSRLTRALTGPPAPEKIKVLVLEFTLPLKQPVLAEAEGFSFSTYDPSFFIWFDHVKDRPVRLAGAPEGCKAEIAAASKDVAELQQLGESAFAAGGGVRIGTGHSRLVTVACGK